MDSEPILIGEGAKVWAGECDVFIDLPSEQTIMITGDAARSVWAQLQRVDWEQVALDYEEIHCQ
jgi:hypothetical protein